MEIKFDDAFTPQSPWVDLVNSQQWDGFGRLTDHPTSPLWVRRFLRCWKIDNRKMVGAAKPALEHARGALRRMAEKVAAGRSICPTDVGILNSWLRAPAYMQLRIHGTVISAELRPLHPDW